MAVELLVVASKVKAYVKSKGLRTSADVLEELTNIIKAQIDNAVVVCQDDGQKTLQAKHFPEVT